MGRRGVEGVSRVVVVVVVGGGGGYLGWGAWEEAEWEGGSQQY